MPRTDGPAAAADSAPHIARLKAPVIDTMLGAIVGDIIGSVYEGTGWKSKGFPLFPPSCRFTDDTVLTVATADVLLHGGGYASTYRAYGRRYPDAGYGAAFRSWLQADDAGAYGSWGNGSAMRASPIGWMATSLEGAMAEAKLSAEVTHDHPDGIRGAQAVAVGVFLACHGRSKVEIRNQLEALFDYNLRRTLESIRPYYGFDLSCPGSVPEAIIAFLESSSFVDAIRNAVSLGGDADTQSSIAGALAHAFHREVPCELANAARSLLPREFLAVIEAFSRRQGP